MFKFRKLVIPLAFVFLAQTIVPTAVLGAEATKAKITAPAKTEISLEQAINLVKQNFEVPKEFSQFTSGFNSYNSRQSWSLNWSNPDRNGGSFSAQVDVNSGEIMNMNQWKNTPETESEFNLPQVSYAEAKEIAQQLVNKMLPDRLGELEFVQEDSRVISLNNRGMITYAFQWKRVVNGIQFPGNSVDVQVNGRDGRIMSYNLNWSKDSFPEAQGIISGDKARQSFEKYKMLELQYFTPPQMRPLTATPKAQARLIYQLTNSSSNGAIDAFTGEPVKLENGHWLAQDSLANAGAYNKAGRGEVQQPVLSPEEQKEIEQNEKIITQEQAVEAVKKWINVPDSLILRTANLGMNGYYSRNRVWSLNWSSDQKNQGDVQNIYAQVDAVNGELLAFTFSISSQPNPKTEDQTPMDRAASQQFAEDFLKKIQPERFQKVKLIENPNEYSIKMGARGDLQEFNYQRLEKGVLFPNNGMSVRVDAVSKAIIGYNLNWGELDFPNPTEAMAQGSAETSFLEARPLELKYIQMYDANGLSEIRLVYQPSLKNVLARSNMMDAKTKQFLNWQGEALENLEHPYYFKDIAGNFAEKEISLLGQAGIFGENQDEFKPNENLTMASMLRAMIIAKNGVWQSTNLSDQEVLQKAKALGWLREDVSPADNVNREQMAKLLVRFLNLEKVAHLQNLFQSPYEDVSIDNSAVGYASLVKGLGLMKIEGANFEPERMMTRAEGAYALVKTLKVDF
ncbi:YcdB/YcdC domain-containing protein [Desulfitobacterium sp.]|uniref:YcdB/YcdC domain-containing protein n=1 Tax=Desulfitobacterium sp. TaxID=49981 RepID=UPI002B1EB84F|nr:YcdB/YcdC domain-containing protein [Desulfitobacterium sp.]MEA4903157.1 S-layer homology domain-containing protein [Desulfitobacterium sp.]